MSTMSCLLRTLVLLTLAATLTACSRTTGCLPPVSHEPINPSPAQPNAAGFAARGPFDEAAEARKDIAMALAKAKADGKHVLLDFGANWWPDCIALAGIFDDKAVRPFEPASTGQNAICSSHPEDYTSPAV